MTKHKFYLLYLLLALLSCNSYRKPQNKEVTSNVKKIIFETDIGNDVDDVLALDMLYKYLDAGSIDLLCININKEGAYPAEFVDIMNTWYGYPKIPIGIIHKGADCENDAKNYAKSVCLIKKDDGKSSFKRSLKGDYNHLVEAHVLYRKLLAQQPDSSVTIISTGFFTNLARLLDTPADDMSPLTGKELVAKKVKLLCTMAGCFNNTNLFEYNVMKDISAAKKIFSEWPTTLVTSPFEVGIAINYPGRSIENDFSWTFIHPMVEAYKSYQQMPYDRPTWDLTTVLYSVEGSSYFNVSPAGYIHVSDKGTTKFTPDPKGNRYYLTIDSVQAAIIKQHFIEQIIKQPIHYNNKYAD